MGANMGVNMLCQCFKSFFVVAVLVLVGSRFNNAYAKDNSMLMCQLSKTLEKVRAGKSVTIRTNAAERLSNIAHDVDPKLVDDKTLLDIVSLLDTHEDSVRFWVAGALGNLGPRAKAAVPKLLELLPEVDCIRGSLTSAASIRVALTRIGVTPPPEPDCGNKKE
jgi:hypothetical protein